MSTSKRPDFTIAQIVEQFKVSRSTVRRGLNDGRFPQAKKDHHGRWMIPIDDILQAGFPARKTWLNESAQEPDSLAGHEPPKPTQSSSELNDQAGFMNQVHLEKELAHERAQVDKLKALLDAERSHVESLRMALRMIEPRRTTSPETADIPQQPSIDEASPGSPSTAKKPGLFQQIFKSRGHRAR